MYTYSDELYSDLHKDAIGCRPSADWCAHFRKMTPDQKQAEWDSLTKLLDEELLREKAAEQRCIETFEDHIQGCIAVGARDRAEAIRWIVQNLEVDSAEEACYELGLPYSYKEQLSAEFE